MLRRVVRLVGVGILQHGDEHKWKPLVTNRILSVYGRAGAFHCVYFVLVALRSMCQPYAKVY